MNVLLHPRSRVPAILPTWLTLGLISWAGWVLPVAAVDTQTGPETLFQHALLAEESQHDLPTAIGEYEEVLRRLDESLRLAGTTLFRLGECYRKLGRTNEAAVRFERVTRDFSGLDPLATLARQNLSVLRPRVPGGPAEAATVVTSATTPNAFTTNLDQEIALLRSKLDRVTALDSNDAQAAAVEILFPGSMIGLVRRQMLERGEELSRLSVEFSADHPQVKAATYGRDLLYKRLADEVRSQLEAQTLRLEAMIQARENLEAAALRAEQNRAASAPTPATATPPSAATSNRR